MYIVIEIPVLRMLRVEIAVFNTHKQTEIKITVNVKTTLSEINLLNNLSMINDLKVKLINFIYL